MTLPTLCGFPVKMVNNLKGSSPPPGGYVLGSLDSFVLLGVRCERCGKRFTITKEKYEELAGCPFCGK